MRVSELKVGEWYASQSDATKPVQRVKLLGIKGGTPWIRVEVIAGDNHDSHAGYILRPWAEQEELLELRKRALVRMQEGEGKAHELASRAAEVLAQVGLTETLVIQVEGVGWVLAIRPEGLEKILKHEGV